ncbi:major facilitator superfamily domain-containing protein [Lipomyces tetrasporus]|uniref:Major facilitator superfamily domain-containing protein n=1 Tax=Lipomyces tetrasporus TaxID=54092 RepID=A0AAD7QT42_9ASCO|nr:major facilitator superfamily domain-containing protein [Lipomyces tetrasporus]KAJ8100833.1 major facilitator superfamily domain-containing protein [Lipomyces tetrasporus]
MSTTVFTPDTSGETDLEKQSNLPDQIPESNTPAKSTDNSDSPDTSIKESAPTRTIVGFRWFLVCLATFSANLLYGLDTTIAADLQAAVSNSFDNVTQMGWLGVGFTLGSVVTILPLGKAYAIFDTKWLFIGCLTMFAAGSALCGAAPSMNAMIVGRAWAGAGGAGMYLGTLNLVSTTTTLREAAFYVGFIGFVYGGGCILGPIIGGSLADSSATWRWAFYLNLVLFGVMSPIYLFVLPSLPRHPDKTFLEKIKKLDWLGIILTTATYVCFVLAFTFGGAIWDWNDGRFIALVVLFVIFTTAFAITQYFAVFTNETDRLFPCEFLGNPQLVLLYICMACGGASLFVAVYYIPFYFLFVDGESGVEAAIRLLPLICIYVAAILTCGYAMPRTGYHMAWYLFSGVVLTAGGATMYTMKTSSPPAHVYGFSVLLGLGLTVSQAGYDVTTRLVKADKISEAIQFMNISQGQSQLLGLAIASAIFQSEAFRGMKDLLGGMGFSDQEIQGAIAGSRSQFLDTISPELRRKCLDIIVHVIDLEWVLVMAAGALQTICALFMSRRRFPS